MINPDHQIEDSLERLAEVVSLRADEKSLHRENLKAFMGQSRKPVRSPFAWVMAPAVRYVSAFALFLVLGGSGVVSVAEGAQPGDVLYPMKLKVTEPTHAALILNKEDKTKYTLERADRRLKEFALAAASEQPDPETTALITESLNDRIADVADDVTLLVASGEADEALKTNAELQSVLSAHSLVLDTISEQNPEAAAVVDTVSESVDAGIARTENAANDITSDVATSIDDTVSLDGLVTESDVARAAIRAFVAENTTLNATDTVMVTTALTEIDTILEDARIAHDAGTTKDAILLYTEAHQRLTELKTLIEADRDLGIGIVTSQDSEEPVATSTDTSL